MPWAFVAHPDKAHLWASVALALRLGFGGLLRPGELDGLRCNDVLVTGGRVVVVIRHPKTRSSFGRVQYAQVDDPLLAAWLTWWLSGLPPSSRLFQHPVKSFPRLLGCLLTHLGADARLTAASLRTGGATAYLLAGVAVYRLRFWGRWKDPRTLEHYAQETVATLVLQQMSAAATAGLQQIVDACPGGPSPPARHWSTFMQRGF